MTKEQYETLLPYKPTILTRAATGQVAGEIGNIYTNMTGQIPKLHCGVCVGEMLDYLTGQINNYERAKEKHQGC